MVEGYGDIKRCQFLVLVRTGSWGTDNVVIEQLRLMDVSKIEWTKCKMVPRRELKNPQLHHRDPN